MTLVSSVAASNVVYAMIEQTWLQCVKYIFRQFLCWFVYLCT